MRKIGSQSRELLSETEYTVAGRLDGHSSDGVILKDADGKYELWVPNNHYAGYVIDIDGVGHEFVRTAAMGDLWWAGISNIPVEKKTETKVSNSIQFDRERLLRIFEDAGYNFPANASIKIQVPRGGDYSGCLLDIDSECPLTIGWDEVIDVEFVSPS